MSPVQEKVILPNNHLISFYSRFNKKKYVCILCIAQINELQFCMITNSNFHHTLLNNTQIHTYTHTHKYTFLHHTICFCYKSK